MAAWVVQQLGMDEWQNRTVKNVGNPTTLRRSQALQSEPPDPGPAGVELLLAGETLNESETPRTNQAEEVEVSHATSVEVRASSSSRVEVDKVCPRFG